MHKAGVDVLSKDIHAKIFKIGEDNSIAALKDVEESHVSYVSVTSLVMKLELCYTFGR